MKIKVFSYSCEECEFEEMLFDEDKKHPDFCPICGSSLALYTNINGPGKKYRVLVSKKASNIEADDLFFDKYYNKAHRVKGVRITTKDCEPAVSIGIEGIGSRTYLYDDVVYCVSGVWDCNQ